MVKQVHLLAAATILDPRLKKNHFTDHVACSRAINRISTSILDITRQQLPQNNSEEVDAIEETGNDMKKGIWDFHKFLVKKQLSLYTAHAQESEGLNEEFKHYLSQAVVHLNYDPIYTLLARTKKLYLSPTSLNSRDVYEYRRIICSL